MDLTESTSPEGMNASHVSIVPNWQLLNWQSIFLWAYEATVIGIHTWRQQHLLVSSWVFEMSEQFRKKRKTDRLFSPTWINERSSKCSLKRWFLKEKTKKNNEFPPESEHKLPQRVGGHCGYKWRFLWVATFRVNPCTIAIGQCCERNVLSFFRDKQDYK